FVAPEVVLTPSKTSRLEGTWPLACSSGTLVVHSTTDGVETAFLEWQGGVMKAARALRSFFSALRSASVPKVRLLEPAAPPKPGLFPPVHSEGRLLVDGAISMEIPALLARQLGATHVISVHLPPQGGEYQPQNMFQVVNRCFQILQTHTEEGWRSASDLVITP